MSEETPLVPEGCLLLITPSLFHLQTPKMELPLTLDMGTATERQKKTVKYLASLALADMCIGTKDTAAWLKWGREP